MGVRGKRNDKTKWRSVSPPSLFDKTSISAFYSFLALTLIKLPPFAAFKLLAARQTTSNFELHLKLQISTFNSHFNSHFNYISTFQLHLHFSTSNFNFQLSFQFSLQLHLHFSTTTFTLTSLSSLQHLQQLTNITISTYNS
jgi:hypothetical protein